MSKLEETYGKEFDYITKLENRVQELEKQLKHTNKGVQRLSEKAHRHVERHLDYKKENTRLKAEYNQYKKDAMEARAVHVSEIQRLNAELEKAKEEVSYCNDVYEWGHLKEENQKLESALKIADEALDEYSCTHNSRWCCDGEDARLARQKIKEVLND